MIRKTVSYRDGDITIKYYALGILIYKAVINDGIAREYSRLIA